MQTKLILILGSALVYIFSVLGVYWYADNEGYNKGVFDTTDKIKTEQLAAINASNKEINSDNKTVALVSKDLEIKKTYSDKLKDKSNEIIAKQIVEVPVYRECVVPVDGVRNANSTATDLNKLRHSGEPVGTLSRP